MQVLDLTVIKPPDFFQYGLACLEQLAALGDNCAKSVRENLRIVVCCCEFFFLLLICSPFFSQ